MIAITKNFDSGATECDRQSVWHHLTQHSIFDNTNPFLVVEGEGLRIKDATGKEYLDASSGGLWTVNLGYGRKSIAQAVYQQLLKMCYHSMTGGNEPSARFANALLSKMPGMGRVYFSETQGQRPMKRPSK